MNNIPFKFYSIYTLPVLLGKKARNVYELMDGIKTVPPESIYYHTHKFLKQHHYLIPEPPNDFAYWTRNVLMQPELGEQLASVNIVEFDNLEVLRNKFTDILENHDRTAYGINSSDGMEFRFMSCKSFLFRTKYEANNLKEFLEIIRKIDISTFYINVFYSRLKDDMKGNNFAAWFEMTGQHALSEKINRIDPYTLTLEGLRKKIIELITKYGKY
ncbi:MAG: DUF5752 family protein [Ignavibacteria bacterium]|nr:DUF5752 family protein [Ignavibacteria bacterium]